MNPKPVFRIVPTAPSGHHDDPAGIVITGGGIGAQLGRGLPRLRAFVYGEEPSIIPTLPFGRWKEAS